MKIPFSRTIKALFRTSINYLTTLPFSCTEDCKEEYLHELKSGYYDKCYKPPFSIEDRTVLDIGARCGETAYYFKKYCKVKKVICIESNLEMLPYLKKNDKWVDDIILRQFKLSDLTDLTYDYVKIDIEGYEQLILDAKLRITKPCVIETHTWYLTNAFESIGFVRLISPEKMSGVCTMSNIYRVGL